MPFESDEEKEFAAEVERGAEMAAEAVSHVIEMDRFVRIELQDGPVEERGRNGVFMTELMEKLIEHMKRLNAALPSREGAIAITNFETGLLWLKHKH